MTALTGLPVAADPPASAAAEPEVVTAPTPAVPDESAFPWVLPATGALLAALAVVGVLVRRRCARS